jgi:nucleotide-binding universal stress UspA family protein
MAAYVKRAAAIFGARVTLAHVFDLCSHDAFQLYVRPLSEVAEEQQNVARDKLDSFLKSEFPVGECPRILLSGDAATQITHLARTKGFNLIVMPTHAGLFRRTLLGSTTAKVLNDADCPVLTTQHAETISPRHLEHREWVCAIGLDSDSQRVLCYASQAAESVHANLTLVHVIPASGPDLPVEFGFGRAPAVVEKRSSEPSHRGVAKRREFARTGQHRHRPDSRHADRGRAQITSGCASDRKKSAVRRPGPLAGSQLRNSP